MILDHYHNPRNFGTLKNTPSASAENPTCGDKIRIDVLCENNIIKDIKFSGSGCAISLSAASLLTEHVKGKNINDLKKYTKDDMLELLGIPLSPVRLKCGLLALETLQKALQ